MKKETWVYRELCIDLSQDVANSKMHMLQYNKYMTMYKLNLQLSI